MEAHGPWCDTATPVLFLCGLIFTDRSEDLQQVTCSVLTRWIRNSHTPFAEECWGLVPQSSQHFSCSHFMEDKEGWTDQAWEPPPWTQQHQTPSRRKPNPSSIPYSDKTVKETVTGYRKQHYLTPILASLPSFILGYCSLFQLASNGT